MFNLKFEFVKAGKSVKHFVELQVGTADEVTEPLHVQLLQQLIFFTDYKMQDRAF